MGFILRLHEQTVIISQGSQQARAIVTDIVAHKASLEVVCVPQTTVVALH